MKIPFYAKAALAFICIFALVYTLLIGREIIIPIVYATILAIVLNPIVNMLLRHNFNKIVAITLTVVLTSIAVVFCFYFISLRIAEFSESYPLLKVKFNTTLTELVHWTSNTFNIRHSKINQWILESKSEAISDFAIGESLTEVGQLLMSIMLLPVYLFMILFYKSHLLEFVHQLFRTEHQTAVLEVLTNTKQIIQTYLFGIFIELIIMAILHSAGLLLLGIKYAVVLGILGALLNILPYIGGIIATLLAMIIAFVTKETLTYPILVLILYIVIQFIDNNYIVPIIVASRVKINALISVVVILIGGALWGISGMFLSIPLTAILKVIFDHVEPLKPWGYLMGNIVSTSNLHPKLKLKKIKL